MMYFNNSNRDLLISETVLDLDSHVTEHALLRKREYHVLVLFYRRKQSLLKAFKS